MAIYNASLLISASNATYFTNVTGGIAAVAVRNFNDTWISSSALLTGSNTFVGNQIISGNVDINGTISASLQTGYIYVGDGNGRTQAVATSSIVTNINTGSFATTGSNTFYGDQIISGNVLPLVNGQGDIGNDTYKWNKIVVNGELKGSSLNTTGRGVVGTLRVSDETFPLSFLSDREIVGDGTGANTHLYYGTSSVDVTALREIVYTQSGSNADFGNVSASFNTRIDNLSGITGSFATTGSNVFKGTQYLYSTDGSAPLQISSSAYYGIDLYNQGIQIQGPGGPRIQFPNATWLNGNENDNFQFTGDTDNPLTRGLDFYLYGSGSRAMNFRNASGPGATIQFRNDSGSITFNADNNNMGLNAGGTISITGSQTNINGLRYPQTDGTNGQALITNGSGILSFGNVTINTGSFATTGSNTFNGDQSIRGDIQLLSGSNLGKITFPNNSQLSGIYGDQFKFSASETSAQFLINSSSSPLNMIFENRGNGGQTQFLTTYGSEYHSASSYQFNGGNVTINGNIYAANLTGSSGVSGSYATLGANLFTGSQTIQSGSQIIFNGLNGSSNDNGLVWGASTSYPAKLFYQSGSGGNFLQFAGDVGIDFSVGSPATANSNINFRTQNALGQIQFTSDSSSISLKSGTTTTISGSTNISLNTNTTGNINNRGVVTIAQNVGTSLGEVYMLGYSGSLVLGAQTQSPTYAALSHISSSQPNGNINLIFKSNSNAGTTIISGSNNIFVNPSNPTTGYIKYIGGNNNIYLNNNAGIASEITASAISISGTRPLMNSNIWQGNAAFIINQAPNSGTGGTGHVYSNNIFGSANNFTINALAYTGSSFTLSDNIFKNGLNTINPASASLAEIAAGVSGSAGSGFEFVRNIMIGTSQATINIGPKMSNPSFNSYIGNVFNGGALQITNISSSLQVNANANFGNGTMLYTNAGAAGLALHRNAGSMNSNYGSMNLIASASAIAALGNTSPASLAVTNQSFSGSLGSGSINYTNNAVFGASNTYLVTGSYGGTLGAGAQFSSNGIFGVSNTFFAEVTGKGNYVNFAGNVIGGSNLILTGSQNLTLNEAGGAHFGRWNANDGRRNTTGETIFSVGTGVSGSRKTGFLIDSGSNTFVEGSLNVSGSSSMTGSVAVTGNQTLQSFTILSNVSASLNYADDTAAAAGGVPLGGLYRNGNFVMIRLT